MPGRGAFIRQFEIALKQFAEALDLRHHFIQNLSLHTLAAARYVQAALVRGWS
jgi:hypothetical protein